MRARKLTLKKETLAVLASEDLRVVGGGSVGPTCHSCLTVCGICAPSATCPGSEPLTAAFWCPGIGLTQRCA